MANPRSPIAESIELLSREKNIDPEAVITALKEAIRRAYEKQFKAMGEEIDVEYNPETGQIEIVRYSVVDDVGTVISGLPMVGMPFEFQRAIIDQAFRVQRPGNFVLQYSYSPVVPIPARRLGIKAQLVRWVPLNFPPASVWLYRRSAEFVHAPPAR